MNLSLLIGACVFLGRATTQQSSDTVREELIQALYGSERQVLMTHACGPIAVSAVCRLLGQEVTVEAAIQECVWNETRATTVGAVANALTRLTGSRWKAVQYTHSERARALQAMDLPAVLVLPAKGSEMAHAMVLIQRQQDGMLDVFDYPMMPTAMSVGELCELWEGGCVVLDHNRAEQLVRRWPMVSIGIAALIIAALSRILFGRRKLKNRFNAAIAGLAVCCGLATNGEAAFAPPFPVKTENIGRIEAGIDVTRTVTVTNSTGQAVRLTEAIVSCGACVHVEQGLAGRQVGPGESVDVVVKLSTAGKRGSYSQWIAFPVEGEQAPLVQHWFRGEVAGVWASCGSLNLGIVRVGGAAKFSFVILADKLSKAEVSSLIGVGGFSDVRLTHVRDGRQAPEGFIVVASVEGSWAASDAPGQVVGNFVIVMKDAGTERVLNVPVRAMCVELGRGDFHTAYLGVLEPGRSTRDVSVMSERSRTALTSEQCLEAVVIGGDGLAATAVWGQSGDSIRLELEITASRVPEELAVCRRSVEIRSNGEIVCVVKCVYVVDGRKRDVQ